VHTLLREAAAAIVEADLRRGLHLELAAALEALPTWPGRLAEIAFHRRAALPAGNPQVMVDRTVAAAEAALGVLRTRRRSRSAPQASLPLGRTAPTLPRGGGGPNCCVRWARRRRMPAI
jgi:hypothetical protein